MDKIQLYCGFGFGPKPLFLRPAATPVQSVSLSYRCIIAALLLSNCLSDNYWTTTGTGCAGRGGWKVGGKWVKGGLDGVYVEVDLEGGVAAVVEELLAGHEEVLAHLTGVEGGLYLEHKLADVLLFDFGY